MQKAFYKAQTLRADATLIRGGGCFERAVAIGLRQTLGGEAYMGEVSNAAADAFDDVAALWSCREDPPPMDVRAHKVALMEGVGDAIGLLMALHFEDP